MFTGSPVAAAGSPLSSPHSPSVENLERMASSPTRTPEEKLAIVAQEFEQIIFRQMFRSVQKSSFGQGFLDESGANSQYSEMVLQQLSDTLASTASLGIGDSLHAQLLLDHTPDPAVDHAKTTQPQP